MSDNQKSIEQIIHQTVDMMSVRSVRDFTIPPMTYIGAGAVSCIGQVISERCAVGKVFVVMDEIIEKLDLAAPMFRALKSRDIPWVEYIQPTGEPESKLVEEATRSFLQSGCDAIVAIGGGSALDAAKGIALLAAHPNMTARDMYDPANIVNKRVDFIAVPTTAGTGSEATNVTVITDSETRLKHLIAHPDLMPDLALIDACLMLKLPSSVTAATGVDALTHAVEAYVAQKATPMTRALAYQALRMIGDALPIVVGQGSNIQAREDMALASYMAGTAFSNAGLGLVHAMAHQVGAFYHIPHGVANALILPTVMCFNELVCKKDYADIGLALSGELMDAKSTIAYIQELIISVGLPANLAAVGVNVDDFEMLATQAMQDHTLPTNPRTVTHQQVVELFHHAYNRTLQQGGVTILR